MLSWLFEYVSDRVRITKHNNVSSIYYNGKWSKEIFMIDSLFKINPWEYKRLKRRKLNRKLL